MVLRERYPAGVPCWMDLAPPDPEAARDFYGGLFGWRFVDRSTGGRYFTAQLDGADVAGIGAPGEAWPVAAAWNLHVAVDDVDAAAERVRAAGGTVLGGPWASAGAGVSARCADPAGAVFGVWQDRGRAGAQVVNVPGTWNFNDLATTDPTGAEAFYGAVFGWRAVPVDFGLETSVMWCRPGYGDFLASIDPEIRRRHAEQATPGSFTDAVGWMAGGAERPPAWGVTFAVDDTDGVVARARELGAKVTADAHDAGVVRLAVLEDPQGAAFTVSHYRPGSA